MPSRAEALQVITRGTDTSGRPLRGTRQMFELHDRINNRLGGVFVPIQGSFNRGVSASAGTHDEAGCWDWRSWNLTPTQVVIALHEGRDNALALFPRTEADGFDPHLHGTLLSDAPMTPETAWQVGEYKAGRNMLSSRLPDPYYRPSPLVTVYHYQGADMALTEGEHRALLNTADNVREVEAMLRRFIPAEVQRDAAEARRDRDRAVAQHKQMANAVDRIGMLERGLEGNDEKITKLRAELRATRTELLAALADPPPGADPADIPGEG